MSTLKVPAEFVVDRSKWLRGEGSECSRLYRPGDGKQCCIGFLGEACGLTKDDMNSLSELGEAAISGSQELVDLANTGSVFTAYAVNDYEEMDDAARESEITDLMDALGIKVTFVDGEANVPS